MALAWRRRARPLLGTLVEIAVRCDSDEAMLRLSAPAFARVQRFHDAMTFHQTTSDVRALAAAAAGTRVRVSADTHAVLAVALALESETQGVFNVAVADRLVARGVLPRPLDDRRAAAACGGVADRDAAAVASARPPLPSALASLRLDEADQVVVLAPVGIDLGGIAKGAAVDAAIAALRAAGAHEAVVNAGGDLAVLGDAAQPIVVRGPHGVRVAVGTLADGAVATSGPYAADAGALVAPDGRRALWADRTVSVVAPRCVIADALTKVVAILGPEAAFVLARHGAQAIAVGANGDVTFVGAGDAVSCDVADQSALPA